jgi:hypothetical protein
MRLLIDILFLLSAVACWGAAIYWRNLAEFWREVAGSQEPARNRRRTPPADLTPCIRRAAARRQLCGMERSRIYP